MGVAEALQSLASKTSCNAWPSESRLVTVIVLFYRKVDLSEGLHLLQPRLIAGVSVAHVPSPATGKQTKKLINGFHRGRLAGRRKS